MAPYCRAYKVHFTKSLVHDAFSFWKLLHFERCIIVYLPVRRLSNKVPPLLDNQPWSET